MLTLERPDLSRTEPAVRAYVEALEAELARAPARPAPRPARETEPRAEASLEILDSGPCELPSAWNVITISASGSIKRTPRHLYGRQRRGGMGVFDLDTPESDPPAFLLTAEESSGLVLLTDAGRAFRLPLAEIPASPVRSRGQPLAGRFPLRPNEHLALVFPDRGDTYLVLVTRRGQVRRWRNNYLGDSLHSGSILYEPREGGPPAAACWTPGDGDLLIATRKGDAIRFAERQVPVRGCLGLRVDPDDAVAGMAPVRPDGGVFLLGADGRGTIRLMGGFSANKEPGSGGKQVIKAEQLVGLVRLGGASEAAGEHDDIFAITRLGKIIRFSAGEVPPKEGIVQGVNCMTLRADECVALFGAPQALTVSGASSGAAAI